jgi:hypothetical protein
MMEKLLLFLDYECHMQQVQIPWDDIVRRLQPGSSGPCATQMLLKMRERLVVEGHMVPPEKTKPHIKPNPKVRGFVRKDSNRKITGLKKSNDCNIKWIGASNQKRGSASHDEQSTGSADE